MTLAIKNQEEVISVWLTNSQNHAAKAKIKAGIYYCLSEDPNFRVELKYIEHSLSTLVPSKNSSKEEKQRETGTSTNAESGSDDDEDEEE